MRGKSKAVVYIGMVYPWGGIRHFALLGCELFKECRGIADFYYASIIKDVDDGCWDFVRKYIPSERIIAEENFSALALRVVNLGRDYDRVIVHTGGGWGQTKHFINALRTFDKNYRQKISLVATTHSYRNDSWKRIPMSLFQYVLYRLFYRMVVFQCQYAADRFIGGNKLIKKGKGAIVPLGCESFNDIIEEVPSGIASNIELRKILIDDSLFKFVYLAAFRPGKMHVWMIRALAPLIRLYPEIRLLLCGEGREDIRLSILKVISEENLEHQIFLTGQIARREVPWLLSHSNCAIVPSRSETFGHSFLEPMFAGVPVIGTKVGIGSEIIEDGVTGFHFSLASEESLRIAVEKIISDKSNAKKMGGDARILVEKQFNHSAVAKKLSSLYMRIFNNII